MALCVEKLEALAEWLEAGTPEHNGVTRFNMRWWARPESELMRPESELISKSASKNGCGTVCCIAGTVAMWEAEGDYSKAVNDGYLPIVARDALGLTNIQASELFTPDIDLDNISSAWAARTIRHLIATGEVDWEDTRNPK